MAMIGKKTKKYSRVKVLQCKTMKGLRSVPRNKWNVLSEPQDIVNWLVILSMGMDRAGYVGEIFHDKLTNYTVNILIRREDMSIKKVNTMVIRAMSKVRFGFELGRVTRRIKI